MTDTIANVSQDPAEIERDIRRTQDEMSRTVDRIGDQLTPRNLMNALLDKAEDNNIDARYLLDGARRNPLALAMLAGGAIWLVSDSDAKLPKIGSGSKSSSATDHLDPSHRDYVSHMSAVEWRQDEDEAAYQRRRDIARSNYFMIERAHDEDEGSFRQRLDQAGERFREMRHSWMDTGRSAGRSVGSTASSAANRTQQAFDSNPLIGGLVAAAVGAMFGNALPLTRTEQDNLASAGRKARDVIDEEKDQLADLARQKKDDLVTRVENASQAPSEKQASAEGAGEQRQHEFGSGTSSGFDPA